MPKYNRGQKYEDYIKEILSNRSLLPDNLGGNDAGFIHCGNTYYLEIKNRLAPDFGQKGLVWDENRRWQWREIDCITNSYDQIGVKDLIDPDFIPRRYSKSQNELTKDDRCFDQEKFEKSNIPLDNPSILCEYYGRKFCHYIQIEGKGLYYLSADVANLGVPQFAPPLKLRLRAKTHYDKPIHAYSFFAVIQIHRRGIATSNYDIEEKVGVFPPILYER